MLAATSHPADDVSASGAVRHQRHLLRLHLQHQLQKLLAGIALDIELGAQQRAQRIHIRTANVTLVGTGMHRDAIRSKSFTIHGHLLHIRHVAASRIAQGSYLVHIYTQVCHYLVV